jgi:hypothetical protein
MHFELHPRLHAADGEAARVAAVRAGNPGHAFRAGSVGENLAVLGVGDRVRLATLDDPRRVANRFDVFRHVVGDNYVEFFFESHDQLDGVQAVSAQVIYEFSTLGYFTRVYAQMEGNDLADPLKDARCPRCLGSRVMRGGDVTVGCACARSLSVAGQ